MPARVDRTALGNTEPHLGPLQPAPDDMAAFVEHSVERVLGPDPDVREAGAPEGDARDRPHAALCDEIVDFLARVLGPDYAWPGNVRELEQCVRSFVVKHDYKPKAVRDPMRQPQAPAADPLRAVLGRLDLSASALVDRYCQALHERLGSISEVAQQTGLTRPTVRRRIARAKP
jgi:hypothetical protein